MRLRRRVPEVVVVTRQGCHLCTEMVRAVAQGAGRATVLERDLDAELAQGRIDPALHERWTTLVPVLLVDGREVAHHRVDPAQVRRAVRRSRPAVPGP